MQPAAHLQVLVTANTVGATRGLTKVNSQLGATAATGKKMSGNLKAVAGTLALVGGAAASTATRLTVDFDRSMRNVNSIAQLGEKRFQNLQQEVLKLAGPTAQAPDTLAKGLYDLVSSGFTANESLRILNSTARAASAGLTTTEVATKAVAAVLNAYEMPASKAAAVSDVLFRVVDRGVISFEALSSSIGDALPFAAELNVNIQQVGAAFATLTKKGISPEETATRIKGALVALVKPSTDMKRAFQELGVTTGEQLIRKFGSLQAALQALRQTTGGNKEAFQRLFPDIRGASAALLLTGKNARTAAGDLSKLKDSSGSTAKALSQQSKSVAFQWQQTKAEISAALIKIGLVAIPVFRKIVQAIVGWQEITSKAIRAVGRFFTDVWTRPKKAFGDLLASILRGFAKVFDAASHLPGVGGKFKDLAAQVRRSANNVDRLGEEIKDVKSKRVKVDVDVYAAFKASGARDRAIHALPSGDGWGFQGHIDRYAKSKAAKWGKKKAKDALGLGPVGPLGMLKAGAVDAFNDDAARFGLHVSSGYRPGSITSSGNQSYHSMNRARDYADGAGPMLAFARYMASTYGGRLAELIHSPMGFSIKNGARVSPYAVADHYDHVHVAMQRGGLIPGSGDGDKVHALLEPGEGLINKNAVRAMGGSKAIAAINRAVPRFQKGGMVRAHTAARRAGFRGKALQLALAVAAAESGNFTDMTGDMSLGGSYGPWMVHHPSHPQYNTSRLQHDWTYAAKAAFQISGGGKNWSPWTMYRNGGYQQYMAAAAAVIAGNAKAGKEAKKKGTQGRFKPAPKASGSSGWIEGGPTQGDVFRTRTTAGSDKLAMQGALAGLTEGTADDLRVARQAEQFWVAVLEQAQQQGDIGMVTEAAQNLKATRDSIEELTGATNEQARLLEENTAVHKELLDAQRVNTYLLQTQGPQMVAAVMDLFSQGIGRSASLGRRTPAAPGRTASL